MSQDKLIKSIKESILERCGLSKNKAIQKFFETEIGTSMISMCANQYVKNIDYLDRGSLDKLSNELSFATNAVAAKLFMSFLSSSARDPVWNLVESIEKLHTEE